MEWTGDQQKVIDTRDKNVLVSAAAGSGKTAVLVARIMDRILSPTNPVNIDELLIVTFTRAAAAEMKERISAALADAREKDPDNLHLARQSVLIHNAMITTIDGFCSYVLRSYPQVIDLVPGFRICEDGEGELLLHDACEAVIEAGYGREDEEEKKRFHDFAETFAHGKSDTALEDVILTLFHASESQNDPLAWLEECRRDMGHVTPESFSASGWMKEYMKDAYEEIRVLCREIENNASLCDAPTGPSAYGPNAAAFREFADSLIEAGEDYERIRDILQNFSPPALSRKKGGPEEDPALRELYKRNRDRRIKPLIDELSQEYFGMARGDALSFQAKSEEVLDTLITLTEELHVAYGKEKEKRGLMDFSDLEHNALRILRKEGDRTYAARELASRFREVMIDEYQDSNYLQEAILTSVSRIEDGEMNYFCVGDVKQSIYSFRQARPELFMEKFASYQNSEQGERIDLHANFRSSKGVVDTVNGIFRQIMRREIGGVEYDDGAALVKESGYPDTLLTNSEIDVILTDEEELLEDRDSQTRMELEARAVGSRIRELMKTEILVDPKDNCKERKVEYRDIVILLRTTKGWADTFVRILSEMRIPAYSETKEGYFEAREVETVLNYLSILDNPLQDIPMTAVLSSPFVSLSADELTVIRVEEEARSWSNSHHRDHISMYEAARFYAGHGKIPALRNKLDAFFLLYDEIKSEVHSVPLHELMNKLLRKSGYRDYVSALPGGNQRVLNLRMLMDKSLTYEKTSYVGLYHFIRYIRRMKAREMDFGELSTISEADNVVRIYSIHKSKGLEYPFVFLSGMTKRFNTMDLNRSLMVHPDLGIASDYVNFEDRTRAVTMKKHAIRHRRKKEMLGEELRVLYVAMTRAKQRLFLTATAKDEDAVSDLCPDIPLKERQYPIGFLLGVKDYTGWVLPAAKRLIDYAKQNKETAPVSIRYVRPSDLASAEVEGEVQRATQIRQLRTLKSDVLYDEEMRRKILERFSYQYPHAGRDAIPVEISVSEVKAMAYNDREEEFSEESNREVLYREESSESVVPAFIRNRNPDTITSQAIETQESNVGEGMASMTGAMRGTVYHKVMELLSFVSLRGLQGDALLNEIRSQLQMMAEKGHLTKEEITCIASSDLERLIMDPLGQRMAEAQSRNLLYREQPFVLGVPSSEIREDWPHEEMIYVQGMIDAFFEEDGELVLVDYKTDRVRDARELTQRYEVQTRQYKKALETITQKCVKEVYLWSFDHGCAVKSNGSGEN